MTVTDQQELINLIVQDLKERIHDLKVFQKKDHINTTCDDLVSEILTTIDSAVKHLKDIERELIEEVESYRKQLTCESTQNTSDNEHDLQETLKELSSRIDLFALNNAAISSSYLLTNDKIDSAKEQAEELLNNTKDLRRKMRENAYQKRFLKFRPNSMFTISRNHLGRLEYLEDEVDKALKKNDFSDLTISSQLYEIENERKASFEYACFIDSENFLCCSDDGKVTDVHEPYFLSERLLNRKNEYKFIETQVTEMCINGIAPIPSRTFLLSSDDGWAYFYGCKDSAAFRRHLHDGPILSQTIIDLKMIVTLGADDKITILELYDMATKRHIFGHGCTKYRCQVGVLSNDHLLTCSNDTDECVIRVWDPYTTKKVKEKPAGLRQVCALSVLSSDLIVIASRDGSVKLISLTDDSIDRVFIGPKESNWTSFILVLPNDDIIIADSHTDPSLQIWNPYLGHLKKTFKTGHKAQITWCASSPGSAKLLTASRDSSAKLWEIEFFMDSP